MNILFIDEVHPVLRQMLEEAGMVCKDGTNFNKQQLLDQVRSVDGIVLRSKFKVDQAFLNAAENLKFIARSGSGLENIDLNAAREKGVKVYNSPEGNCTAVAEHALGMLLALMNKMLTADAEVRKKQWRREENRGAELEGKTVGIIGYGHTGSAFAQRLSGFGTKTIACDKYKTDFSNEYVREVSLEELKEQSDVLSFHVPLTSETRYMFNTAFIDQMKKPFFLLNTSRGPVVRTESLVKGLATGKVRGAGLDVLEYEKFNFEETLDLPADFEYLTKSDRVLLTPHVAGWTEESYVKLSRVLGNKILNDFSS